MNYKETIESSYNREAWEQLLHDIFLNKAVFRTPYEVRANQEVAKRVLRLGTITLSDEQQLSVYEVELSEHVDIVRNKRGIRDLLSSDWKSLGHAGAFMFCYRAGEDALRFSYVSETWGFGKNGEYERLSTATQRYTYLLGAGRGCRTAIEQFQRLKASKQTLSDVTAAFSVEVLTRQFYKDLFDWYQWAVSPTSGVHFPKNEAIKAADDETIEKKMIRLITRIMFVWFIKQKGLVPSRLFDISYLEKILKNFDPESKVEGNYYNAILQNLFFATLNRAIEDEQGHKRGFATGAKKDIKTLYRYAEMFSISKQSVMDLFSEVPFLNGGLFECLDKTRTIDGVEQAYDLDGFSRNDKRDGDGHYRHRATVPNALFFEPERGLISILSRYNFTIEENSPEEQQVALDPELLGKVFENLLGVYNPETRETARKESGSFYTPREVVNYMVDESLMAYLGDTPLVRSLFSSEFCYDEARRAEYQEIAHKLRAVKILDPACGSGAFPMGLLSRMVEVLCRIEPEQDVYQLKLSIIENCIYGSDLQSIAAQITKLRFFISLICHCEKDGNRLNYGIPTLPNLETKFVSANSLVSLHQKHEGDHVGDLFENEELPRIKEELKRVRHAHFTAHTAGEKMRLRSRDKALCERLLRILESDENFAPDDIRQLSEWNPYDQNGVAKFFDPEWMFGLSTGFDIVIGNPPYIQLQNNGGELACQYAPCGYETFARTGDIYALFYERGYQLLKPGGHLCYITSNKWMRAGYGEKLRHFLTAKTNPELLIDFSGVRIFESATVDTNILLFSKGANTQHTLCAQTKGQPKDSVKHLSEFVQQTGTECAFQGSDSWVILSPIEQSIKRKIEALGTPLKDWDISINYGIKTGYNEAFIISTEKRDEILSHCQSPEEKARTEELIRPILRGRDIKRYGYNWAGLWLIATFPSRHYDIEQYPAVKAHLLSFGKERLEQTGKTHNVNGKQVKSRKKTSNKWFETQDSISYWEDFGKEKVVYMEIQTDNPREGYPFPCFSYDDRNSVALNTAYIMCSDSVDVRYILGVLNSSVGRMIAKLYVTQLQERQFRMLSQYLAKFPIVQAEPSAMRKIVECVQECLSHETKILADKINKLVYKMYSFNEDEIAYIEEQI